MSDSTLTMTVIIPSYHRPENLRHCLEALARGRRLPQETLVVLHEEDEASQTALQGLSEIAEKVNLRTILVAQAGQVLQMNAGLAEARGDVVCFTDDDCLPHEDWLERLAAPYADPEVSGVGGRDVVYHEGVRSERAGRVVGRISGCGRLLGSHHEVFPPGLREVQHLKGANMSFRRSRMVPLDPRLVLGPGDSPMNDTDLSLSVGEGGGRLLYDPEAQVDHHPAPRHGITHRDPSRPEQAYIDGHNWAYLICKHFPAWRRAVFMAYALLVGSSNRLGLVKFLVTALRGPRVAGRQYLATCRGLRAGVRDWRGAQAELRTEAQGGPR